MNLSLSIILFWGGFVLVIIKKCLLELTEKLADTVELKVAFKLICYFYNIMSRNRNNHDFSGLYKFYTYWEKNLTL